MRYLSNWRSSPRHHRGQERQYEQPGRLQQTGVLHRALAAVKNASWERSYVPIPLGLGARGVGVTSVTRKVPAVWIPSVFDEPGCGVSRRRWRSQRPLLAARIP